jgi:hypothetical protein
MNTKFSSELELQQFLTVGTAGHSRPSDNGRSRIVFTINMYGIRRRGWTEDEENIIFRINVTEKVSSVQLYISGGLLEVTRRATIKPYFEGFKSIGFYY